MYILTTIIFSVFNLTVATAAVRVDTMKFSQPNKNNHLKIFALSVATATVSVDMIIFCVHINNSHVTCLHEALLLQPLVSTR